MKNFLAKIFTSYVMPDYEAHKRAAMLHTSAQEVALRNDLRHALDRAKKAETKIKILSDSMEIIKQKAHKLPDPEVLATSFVHETLTEFDNAQHWINKI